MDLLVRAALLVQAGLRRGAGLGSAAILGGYLVATATEPARSPLAGGVLAAGAVITGVLGWKRLARVDRDVVTEAALFCHLAALTFAGVLAAPGGLGGPYQAAVYVLTMLVAAYARPGATLITVGYAAALDASLCLAFEHSLESFAPRAALLVVFASLNAAVRRAEIARIRALSRARVDGELERLREAARSYRLIAAPSAGPQSLRAAGPSDEERLLRSGVDEIHQAVALALDLVRRTLDLRTAALLWLDTAGTQLHVQELSTSSDEVLPGPFDVQSGLVAAALARRAPVSNCGAHVASQLPYYEGFVAVGSASAVPVLDHGHARGVLMVDRESPEPFGETEERLLLDTARFLLRAIENERVFVQLERAKSEQGKLYRATDALSSAITEGEVIEAGVSSAREIASFDFAVVTLFDRGRGEHEICAASGADTAALVGQRFRHNQGLVSMVVANRHALPYRGEYDADRQVVFTRRVAPPAMPSLLVLPLTVHDRALGTLVLGSRRRAAFGDAVRPTLEVLASHIAVSLANARMVKRLEDLATTDGLTGLYNKRALIELGTQKTKSAVRFQRPLSVLVCDIDFFKKVNDTYGHDVGDVVIKGFGDVLKRVKRDTDVVGRFGGEEFVIVCEETDPRGALLLGERIRSELEATSFDTDRGPLQVTCSVGAASMPDAGATWDTLFKATDEALYASKRGGRNRVTAWSRKVAGAA